MQLSSFGCSFIFGSDLHDVTEDQFPSQFTWPALLSKKLGFSYECNARPGSGNLQIAERVLSSISTNKSQLYVVGWSWIDRFDYIDTPDPNAPVLDPLGWRTILPVEESLYSQFYYKNLHTQLRDKITTLIHIKLVIDTLQQNNLPFLMTYIDDLIFEIEDKPNNTVSYLQNFIRPYMKNFNGKNFLDWSRDHGYEVSAGMHPLEQAHANAANFIYEHWPQFIN